MKKGFNLSVIPNQPAGGKKPLFFILIFLFVVVLVGISVLSLIKVFGQSEKALVREKDVSFLRTENKTLGQAGEELREKLTIMKDKVKQLDNEAQRIEPILDVQKLPNSHTSGLSLDGFTISQQLDTLIVISRRNREIFSSVSQKLSKNEKLFSYIPSIKPVNGRLSKGYGYINDIITDQIRFHPGVTFVAAKGSPVYSAADGSVLRKGVEDGIGLFLLIVHSTRYMTKYGHLRSTRVEEGDYIKRGDIIGYVGKTGRVTGPCLYYEVMKNGKRENPLYFIFENIETMERKF